MPNTEPTQTVIATWTTIGGFFLSCIISIAVVISYAGDVKADVKVNASNISKVEKSNNTLYHLEAQKDKDIIGELRSMKTTLVEVRTKVNLLMEER